MEKTKSARGRRADWRPGTTLVIMDRGKGFFSTSTGRITHEYDAALRSGADMVWSRKHKQVHAAFVRTGARAAGEKF